MHEQLFFLMREFNEKQELLNQLSRDTRLSRYSTTELHLIQAIGRAENPNVTQLARALHFSKGAVSKTIKRLTDHGLIRSYQLGENRQKIYYCLTDAGQSLFRLHEERDREWTRRNEAFLSRLSDSELQNASVYLTKYVAFLDEMLRQCEACPETRHREGAFDET